MVCYQATPSFFYSPDVCQCSPTPRSLFFFVIFRERLKVKHPLKVTCSGGAIVKSQPEEAPMVSHGFCQLSGAGLVPAHVGCSAGAGPRRREAAPCSQPSPPAPMASIGAIRSVGRRKATGQHPTGGGTYLMENINNDV